MKKARNGHLKSGIKSSVSTTVGATVDYLEHHDLRFSDITHLSSHQHHHGHASHHGTSAPASSGHATSGHVRGRADHEHAHHAHDRHVHEHFHVTPAFVSNCCIDATDALETMISQFQMTAKNQTDRVAKWEKTLEKLSKKYRDVSPESGGSPNKSSLEGSFQTTQKCMGDRQRQIDDLATLKKKYSDFSASWDDLFDPDCHSEATLFERNRRLALLTTTA